MANDITVTKNTTSGSERFDVVYAVDASGTKTKTLLTSGTMLDRNIRVAVTTPAGAYSADSSASSNSTVTPKINMPSNANTYGFTTDTSAVSGTNGVNYLTLDPDATATAWSVTPRANITTAGYLATGNKNGTAVSQTPSIAGGTNWLVPVVTASVTGGSLSTGANTLTVNKPTVTISASGKFNATDAASYGVTATQPSGTDGTNFLKIDASGSVSNSGSATSSVTVNMGAVTLTNSAGVIAAGNSTPIAAGSHTDGKSGVSIGANVTDNFAARFIPIVTASVSGGGLSVASGGNYSGTPTLSFSDGTDTNMSNTSLGAQNTGTYPYYFKIHGASSALSGTTTVSRAAVTLSNSAGAIAANSNVTKISAASQNATVTVNAGSGDTYLSLMAAGLAASGTASATTTVAPGTVSIAADTTAVSGKTRLEIAPTTNSPTTAYYIASKATAAANSIGTTSAISGTATATVSREGYAASDITGSGSVTGTATAKTSAKSSSVTYFPIPAVSGSIGGSASGGSATAAISNVNSINTITDLTNKTAGTDYWQIKATASGSAGSYTPKYTVSTAGWIASTVTGSAASVSVSSDTTGKSLYIPKATYSTSAGTTTIGTAGYLPAGTVVANIATQTPTTSYANSGLNTYFWAGSSSDYDISITPRYSNSAGYVAEHTLTNNGGVGYWKIKTTSVVQGATSVSGTTATLGTATWGTGWISAGSIGAATLSNTASTNVTYKDLTDTTSAPMLTSGGYLYINKGYTDNVMISLAKLIPDWPSGTSVAAAGHILSGYKAYDQDGGVLTGSIQTKTASDLTVSGRTVTVPAGYYATQVTKSIGVGTVTSGTATISSATYTYDSTNTRFNVTGSANVSAPTVNTAGYISSSEGTRNAKSGGATLSTTVPRIAIAASMSGTAKVTPAISKIETASGNDATNITAQVSAATTTLPTSGYYVAVQSAASANDITATPSVSTAGYGTTTSGQYGATNATLSVGANASSITYLPVAAGACTIAGGGLSITTNYSGTPTITMATGSSTNMANITVGAQDTSNYPYYFKVNASTAALSGKTKATRAAVTDAHTAGYIPAKSATTVISSTAVEPTVTVNAASNATYVSLKQATMTVAGTNTVSPTASVAGNTNVTLGTTNNGIAVTATGGGTASVAATATTNAAGYAPASTQLGSATLSAASKTTTATKYITAINVPKDKAFTLTATADTALDATSNITITTNAYRQFAITNVANADVNITNQGTVDITQNSSTAGIVTINAYNNAATPALTTAKTVVNGGKWVTTTVTPQVATQQGPYYGEVYVNGMSSGTAANGQVDITNGGAVTPTLAKQSTPSGVTNAASGDATATAPSSGVYVAVKSNANTKTLTAKANITTAGYVAVNSSWKSNTSTVGANASSVHYIPITTANPSFTGGAVSGSASMSPTNVTMSDTDNGIKVVASASATRAVVTYNGAVNGWVSKSSGASALAAGSATALTSSTKYISGVKLVPPSSGTRSFTIQVPNGSTSDFISFVFTTDASGNVTVAGPD